MFDNRKFIVEISKKPCLWDINSPEYRNKSKKVEEWSQLCAIMYPDEYGTLTNIELIHKREELKKRWRNLRDYFVKALKSEMRTGVRNTKYIYYNQIKKFLLPMYTTGKPEKKLKNFCLPEIVEVDGGPDYKDDYNDEEEEIEYLEDCFTKTEDVKSVKLFNDSQLSKIRSVFSTASSSNGNSNYYTGYAEDNQSSTQNTTTVVEDDDDKLFLLSLAPLMKRMSPEQNIRTRIELMQVIQNTVNE